MDCAGLIVGIMLGTGIFAVFPKLTAEHNPSVFLILLTWVTGTLVALCGAFCFAELAVRFPDNGGEYVFLKNTYSMKGRSPLSFLFAWAQILVIRPASLVSLSIILAVNTDILIRDGMTFLGGIPSLETRSETIFLVTIGTLAVFTATALFGIRMSRRLQNAFTAAKVLCLAGLIGVGLALGRGHAANLTPLFLPVGATLGGVVKNMGIALIPVMWVLGGWNEAPYIAADMKDPSRNIPLALIAGLLGLGLLYTLINFVYVLHLTPAGLASSWTFSSDLMKTWFGEGGEIVMALILVISTAGAINGLTVTGARMTHAFAADMIAVTSDSLKSPSYVIPLILNLFVSLVMAVVVECRPESIDRLLVFTAGVIWIFFALIALGAIILRRRLGIGAPPLPDAPLPLHSPCFLADVRLYALRGMGIQAPGNLGRDRGPSGGDSGLSGRRPNLEKNAGRNTALGDTVKTTRKKTAKAGPPSSARVKKLQRENRDLREWKRRLSLLLDYGKKLSAHKELDGLLHLLVDVARNVLQADRCSVFLLDKEAGELWSRVASGAPEIRVPSHKGIVGETITNNRVVNIHDAYKDPRFNPEVDKTTGYATKNLLTAPMRNNKGEVIGAFQVLNKRNGPFTANDEEILTIFAAQAATAVENAQLYGELRAAAKDTIFRLAAAAEYKDMDTRSHLERMSRYSAIIAEEIGMPAEWVQNLQLAAPMHDIGKLGVPDAILKKPGKLDETEWVEMKRHPIYGADILKGSDNELLRMSQRVALSHHERWDGTGYPHGLKGEGIPVEGRISTLADVFDALTSKRCYKPAYAVEESLRLIREGAGKQFDPGIVDAFFRALPRIKQVMEIFMDDPVPQSGGPALS
jgi:HD-GYP domain-containing protein (c-di-GMP phosphodiesterase class II)/amino acid transporter